MTRERQQKYQRTAQGKYTKLKFRAKEFNRELCLTLRQYINLTKKPCRYCGRALPEVGYGIDRLDNSKGYTKANSVPCCGKCNKAKSNMSEKEFKSLIEAIYNNFIVQKK